MAHHPPHITIRQTKLIPITNTHWSWQEVNQRLTTNPSLLTKIKLLFRPWNTVLAPLSSPCAVTTLDGNPLYQYQELAGTTYNLQPEPAPCRH